MSLKGKEINEFDIVIESSIAGTELLLEKFLLKPNEAKAYAASSDMKVNWIRIQSFDPNFKKVEQMVDKVIDVAKRGGSETEMYKCFGSNVLTKQTLTSEISKLFGFEKPYEDTLKTTPNVDMVIEYRKNIQINSKKIQAMLKDKKEEIKNLDTDKDVKKSAKKVVGEAYLSLNRVIKSIDMMYPVIFNVVKKAMKDDNKK